MAVLDAALLLSLLAISSASMDTGCTAGPGGTCHSLRTDCNGEHGYEWAECVAAARSCQKIPSRSSCRIDCHSTVEQDVPSTVSSTPKPCNITLEASSIEPRCFSVRVRWELQEGSGNIEALRGFQVVAVTGESYQPAEQCACLDDPDAREFILHGLYYDQTPSEQFTIEVKVMSLPYSSEQVPLPVTQPVPTSCRDLPYEPGRCVPPRYGTVQNVRITTTLVSGSQEKMQVHLSWKPPNTVNPFPDPSTYYILLQDPTREIINFRVDDSLNVTLVPLDATKSYKIAIQPYVRCAGLDEWLNNGCGLKSQPVDVSYVPGPTTSMTTPLGLADSRSSSTSGDTPPSILTSTSPITSPTSITAPPEPVPVTMTSRATSITTHPKPTDPMASSSTGIRNDIILPVILIPTIIAIISIAVLAYVCTLKKWKRKHNSATQALYQIEMDPIPEHSSFSYLDPDPQICQTTSAGLPVLLIYSPESPEKETQVLMELLVKGLKRYDIDVTSHHWFLRGSLPEWVAWHFQRATAVLVVCNQHLLQEWEQGARGGSVVAALKHLVHASVGRSELSKFAVVLLREIDGQYIPTPYLKNTPRFTVDKVEDIARFVKKQPFYAKP